MKNKINWKNIQMGISAILIYLIMSELQGLPFALCHIDTNNIPLFVKSLYLGCYNTLIASLIILLYKDLLAEKWKDFKEHYKEYFNTYFKYWFLLLGLMMISNMIIMFITKDTTGAENQEQVVKLFKTAPIFTYFSAVIFAPIVEELVFRQSIRNIIKHHNVLFILVSGLVFGGMHITSATTFADFLYIIPYSIPGIIFAYILTKTDNIFTTMGLHFIHNGVLMAIQAFILIFG